MDKISVQEAVLERVKVTFNIADNLQDKYIKQLTSNAFDEFSLITGVSVVEERFLFVIEGVVNKRYARRGSQGIQSEKSSGLWVTYKEDGSDFDEYTSILAKIGGKTSRKPSVIIL